jgi:hypothetical protein
MTPTQTTPTAACNALQLHDIALLLGDAGCCAVIGYSGSCNGVAGTGIDGGSGVQVLAVDRVPFGVKLEDVATKVMVGRSAQGFDVATKAMGPIVFRRFDLAASPWREFLVTPISGPLTLGDVSDGFLSLQAAGDFTVVDLLVNPSTQTAFVVEPATKRVLSLGPSQFSKLPVLALPGRVLVLWKRDDGRVVLTQLSR